MPHLVRDWMSSPVVVVDADSSVSFAMTLMRRRRIHSIIVNISNRNQSYCIVTTTDISTKIVAAGLNPAETAVCDIMSGPLITGSPDWSLMECSQIMEKYKFHHLPIVDENGALVGLISATDIFISVEEQGWEEEK